MRLKFERYNAYDDYKMAIYHDWNGDGANVWIVKWEGAWGSVWYGAVVERGKNSFGEQVWYASNIWNNGWNIGSSARQVAYQSGNAWRTLKAAKRHAFKLVRGY